jgi:hypothetical protein
MDLVKVKKVEGRIKDLKKAFIIEGIKQNELPQVYYKECDENNAMAEILS